VWQIPPEALTDHPVADVQDDREREERYRPPVLGDRHADRAEANAGT
jgi:hypothetical protein